MKVDGSIILAKCMKDAGVEKVFTLCGGHIYRLHMELEKLGVEVIDVRNEGAGSYAALTYAQITGKPGVFIATAGPGVTNTMTAVCDAKSTGTPLMILGGASPAATRLKENLQEYDTVGLMRSSTLWAESCNDTKRVAEYFAMAYRSCMGVAEMGPVYLELPEDVLEDIAVDEEDVFYPTDYVFNGAAAGDPESIRKAAELLVHAQRPAMILGDFCHVGCPDTGVFRELAEYLQIPTSSSRASRGTCFQEDTPLMRTGDAAAKGADVILFFNVKADLAAAKSYNPDAKYISVSRYAKYIGLNRGVTVGIPAFPGVVARQLLDAVKEMTPRRESSAWAQQVAAGREAGIRAFQPAYTAQGKPIPASRVAAELQRFMNDGGRDACLLVDGGDCAMWSLMSSAMLMDDTGKFPGRTHYGTRMGTIGYGMGAAIGMWAATGRPIVLPIGDGSLGEYIGEIFAFAKFGIPVIVLVYNDACYAMIKYGMLKYFDEKDDTDVALTLFNHDGSYFHYEKVAEAVGGYGEYVTDADQILPALNRAKESGKISVINVVTKMSRENFSPATISMMDDFHPAMGTVKE